MKQMRTARQIVENLDAQLTKLNKDTTTPAKANSVAHVTGKMIAMARLQMDFARMVGKVPKMDFIELENRPQQAKPMKAPQNQ